MSTRRTPETPNPLLTIPEVARRIGFGRTTVWRWVRTGRLPAVRSPGGNYRVRSEDADRALSPVRANGARTN